MAAQYEAGRRTSHFPASPTDAFRTYRARRVLLAVTGMEDYAGRELVSIVDTPRVIQRGSPKSGRAKSFNIVIVFVKAEEHEIVRRLVRAPLGRYDKREGRDSTPLTDMELVRKMAALCGRVS